MWRDTVVISNDPSFSTVGAIYLIDVSDPSAPSLRKTLVTQLPAGSAVAGVQSTDNGHVANCIAGCDYLYTTGTEEGLTIYDIRDLDNPRYVKAFPMPVPKGGTHGGFTHDVYVDSTGIAWVSGRDGTFGYDTTDPENPRLVYRTDENVVNTGGGLPGDDGSGPLDFQGVRFLDVSDPSDIRQVGFYATAGTFWAAYFAPSDPSGQTVYGLDTAGGIDVLHIDRSGTALPTRTIPVTTADLAKGSPRGTPTQRWGFACPLPNV